MYFNPFERQTSTDDEYYKLLNVARNATEDEIKKSYKRLAKEHHPDRGGDSEKFKEVTTAYSALSDSEKRSRYDRFGKEGVDNAAPDFPFPGMFPEQHRGPPKGPNTEMTISLPLEKMYTGISKTFKITRKDIDPAKTVITCHDCKGQGVKVQTIRMGPMMQQIQQPCANCRGSGKISPMRMVEETVEMHVDPGTPCGHRIILSEKGNCDQVGTLAGDIVITVHTDLHPHFERDKADLIYRHTVSLGEALTGINFSLKTLDGRSLWIRTPPGLVSIPDLVRRWDTHHGYTVTGENAGRVPDATVDKIPNVKQACIREGFSGFVWNKKKKEAVVSALSRQLILERKEECSESILFVAPAKPIKRVIRGEGFPVYKNPTLRGDLVIEFDVTFPIALTNEHTEIITSLLGTSMNVKPEDAEEQEIEVCGEPSTNFDYLYEEEESIPNQAGCVQQ
jgi:DnaJ family protein A protein 2